MPLVATRFALPRQYEAEGVRRYGFHGLSYEYIAARLRELAPDLARGRVIAAHLGNGASLCAMLGGRSIDTTMGLTALDGLVMGTRSGSLDPGVILYLEQQHGMTAEGIENLLYNQSGLLGVSGISSDMRALLASTDSHAREAIDLFVFRIVREIGALAASLGGIDGIVFTAGIGEHAPDIRARVVERLTWLGATLDAARNARADLYISKPESRVALLVVPTDEESMIARHTFDVVRPIETNQDAPAS
jgi:acetate kinase